MKVYEFEAQIQKVEGINGAFIEFPYDVASEFGTQGQVKVVATFDGHEYRGSLAKMGHRCHILGLTQEVRRAIGKQPGDMVKVILQRDDAPRVVDVPEDLQTLLQGHPEAQDFFAGLSFTNRKAYVQWITGAKKPETRERRLREAIELLLHGEKHP